MKKKLFIIVVILFLGSLLFNTSCKTIEEIVYNLNGTWLFELDFYLVGTDTIQITLSGGIATDEYGGVGTYTQNGSNFNITIPWISGTCGSCTDMYNGTFLDVNTISGTFNWTCVWCIDQNGTFIATKY